MAKTMLETRKVYKETMLKRIRRIIKRSFILGLAIGIPLLGLTFRNQIVKASYPSVNEYEIVNDLDQLTPDTKRLALEFLEKCEDAGLDVKITETYRSQSRQDMLYKQGRGSDGPRVTWTKNSIHTKRRAFDIAKAGDDPYGDTEFFEKCAKIGEEVGLEAGHYWSIKDSPHFQNYNWWNRFIY